MRINPEFQLKKIGKQHIIVAASRKSINLTKIYSLNDTAAWLWEKALSLKNFTKSQLTEALCKEYAVDKANAENDVNFILNQWDKANFLMDV